MEMKGILNLSGATIMSLALTSTAVGSGGSNFVVSTKYEDKSISSTNTISTTNLTTELRSQNIRQNTQLSQQIEFIKDVFALTDEELSNILNVERKTLHNWKVSQNIPRHKARQQFFELYVLAQDWKSMDFPSDKISLTRIIFDGKSVANTLSFLNKDELLFMGRHLLRQSDNTELL